MAIQISSTNVINDDRSVRVVADTTAARNAAPVTGMIRYNTSLSEYEFYNGTVWGPIQQVSIATFSDAYAWGNNGSGRLGDNTVTNRSSPVSVVGGFSDWVQISGSNFHTAAIRANGTAWAWGSNTYGRLGNNSTTNTSSPVSVVGGFTNWVQISTGQQHTLALRANGTLWSWGANLGGQLGIGLSSNFASRSSPVAVVGGFTDWIQISAGSQRSIALRANGTVWTWGANGLGALGDNTTITKASPVSVVGGFTDWIQVSAGFGHMVALRANGTAWAWGANQRGQLGTNNTTGRSSPVSVVGGFTDWVQIDGGYRHTAAIRANGTAWAWGYNNTGQLGNNTTTQRNSPVSVVGGFTDWVQIDAGVGQFGSSAGANLHLTTAIRANGTAWAWGHNAYGQLGDNSTTNRSSPVSVVGGFTDWVQVSAGHQHTLAIRR